VLTHTVLICPDVIHRIPATLSSLVPGRHLLLVADQRTRAVAGAELAAALAGSHEVDVCCVPDDASGHIHASVALVDELEAAFPAPYDLYVAVGSGTLCDLTKELAHRRGRPCSVLATAASMNGYTSAIVALLEAGLKTTRPTTPPLAVFADPEMLAAAPAELTLAGLGDLVSRPYCGCDWYIASLVTQEYYCPLPDRLLSAPFSRLLDTLAGLGNGDATTVAELLRLLLVSGITMAITGTSSPASGAEHLLSHFWDMLHLRDGAPVHLHGAQVGVASMVIDRLYRLVERQRFLVLHERPTPSPTQLKEEIAAVFGSLAPAVLPQLTAKLAARDAHQLERLKRHEGQIKERIARTLALGEEVRRTLEAVGAPTSVEQLGITRNELVNAVRHARKIRTRYTVLDVAAELGVLEDFASSLSKTQTPSEKADARPA